jgi:hypothetical protein
MIFNKTFAGEKTPGEKSPAGKSRKHVENFAGDFSTFEKSPIRLR